MEHSHGHRRTAISYWDGRVAPVFDTAPLLRVLETDSGEIVHDSLEVLPDELPLQRTLRLIELGIGTLVCGAISLPMRELIAAYGIEVIPFVAGDLEDVVRAWIRGGFKPLAWAMPGCCGRVRRSYGVLEEPEHGRESGMDGATGDGRGAGQGPGTGGSRRGRMGGPLAGGAGGACLCPGCGHRESHARGVPCAEKKCPKCGALMRRE
jgi:predicted Fe-Mo cluster-binding NifX family protein